MNKLHVAYSDAYLSWNLGAVGHSHPTNPVRALNSVVRLRRHLGNQMSVIDPSPRPGDRESIETIHDKDYVSAVLDSGRSGEWEGANLANAGTALTMFSGTKRLVEGIIAGDIQIGFNPQGAKHHAHYDRSSGFCVFNDMAWAALTLQKEGFKPLYLDWDVHAGDGVQGLLRGTGIPTLSIHGSGIFPYGMNTHSEEGFQAGTTHEWHNPEENFYNWNIGLGNGDAALKDALLSASTVIESYKPDIILLAAGADGHESEDWGMKWTLKGYTKAAGIVAELANKYSKGRVLVGGAGGYQPDYWTPKIWTEVLLTLQKT